MLISQWEAWNQESKERRRRVVWPHPVTFCPLAVGGDMANVSHRPFSGPVTTHQEEERGVVSSCSSSSSPPSDSYVGISRTYTPTHTDTHRLTHSQHGWTLNQRVWRHRQTHPPSKNPQRSLRRGGSKKSFEYFSINPNSLRLLLHPLPPPLTPIFLLIIFFYLFPVGFFVVVVVQKILDDFFNSSIHVSIHPFMHPSGGSFRFSPSFRSGAFRFYRLNRPPFGTSPAKKIHVELDVFKHPALQRIWEHPEASSCEVYQSAVHRRRLTLLIISALFILFNFIFYFLLLFFSYDAVNVLNV